MPLSQVTFDCREVAAAGPVDSPVTTPSASYKYDELRSALLSLPDEFSDDYKLWVREVAIPLKNAGEELFPLFVEFSKRSVKFQGEDDCRAKWDAIKPSPTGKVKRVASIFWHARKHGWTPSDTPARSATLADAESRFPTRTMEQLLGSDYQEEYLVDGVLVRGGPAIFGGPAKSLKTAQLMDLAYNLSIGGKFLATVRLIPWNGPSTLMKGRKTIPNGKS